ncbi:MAG: dihydroneopterin aldolase [Gaiellaceae bacterium]
MIVELRGLQLYGFHGVEEAEKRQGQPFVFDLWLDVGERGADDRIEHAVDYRRVAEAVQEVSARRVDLLEALATRTADVLMERFEPRWLKVRVRKPQVRPAGLPVEFSAVTVERGETWRPSPT